MVANFRDDTWIYIMKKVSTLAILGILSLSACSTPGEENRSDSYTADQVNSRQEAKVVNILAVLPARVQVSNAQNQRAAQIGGALLGAGLGVGLGVGVGHSAGLGALGGVGGTAAGAGAGSLVPGQVMVNGVSLTYTQDGHTFNSAQVGKICEYQPGQAIMIMTSATVTRIQPNAACPVAKPA